MNIEIREKSRAAAQLIIVTGDREVGTVEEYAPGQFMASMRVGDSSMLECGYARGFGDSPDRAAENALSRSREMANNYIRALDDMERLVMGSEVVA